MFLHMYIPKRIESRASKRYLHTHIHSIIRYSQKVEASQVYIEGWIGKQNVVYTYIGLLLNL